MKQIPRYIAVNHPDFPQTLIMETRPPYFMAIPRGIPKKDTEAVEEMLSDIANGRRMAVKLPGFTLFFLPYTTLEPAKLPDEQVIAKLRDMADFYREYIFEKKKHKHRIYQEGVPDDIDEVNGRIIKEARERKKNEIDRG